MVSSFCQMWNALILHDRRTARWRMNTHTHTHTRARARAHTHTHTKHVHTVTHAHEYRMLWTLRIGPSTEFVDLDVSRPFWYTSISSTPSRTVVFVVIVVPFTTCVVCDCEKLLPGPPNDDIDDDMDMLPNPEAPGPLSILDDIMPPPISSGTNIAPPNIGLEKKSACCCCCCCCCCCRRWCWCCCWCCC